MVMSTELYSIFPTLDVYVTELMEAMPVIFFKVKP